EPTAHLLGDDDLDRPVAQGGVVVRKLERSRVLLEPLLVVFERVSEAVVRGRAARNGGDDPPHEPLAEWPVLRPRLHDDPPDGMSEVLVSRELDAPDDQLEV